MALAPIKYVTDGDWGTGEGAPLAPADVDTNFYGVIQRINEAAASAGSPVSIAAIVVDGSTMSVTLTDASVQGPFTLPLAKIRFRGDFAAVTYAVNDLFKVANDGVYIVLQAHTAALPFNPDLAISGNPVYAMVMPAAEQAVRQSTEVSGATYTPALSDHNKLLLMTNAGGCTVTIPAGVFATDDELYFVQKGVSAVIFDHETDVTFAPKPSRELYTDGEGSWVVFKHLGGDVWQRTGEFAQVEVTA